MRQGRAFRRCTKCGKAVQERRCESCGSDRWTWSYVVDIAPSGAPRDQRSRGGFATKAAAIAAMHALQAAANAGGFVEPSRMTVAQYLSGWLMSVRPPAVRGGTWRGYEVNVRRHLIPRLGAIPLQQLTRAAVKAAYQDLAAHGSLKGGTLTVKTAHNIHLTLRKALGDAVEDRLATHNAADGAHRLPRDRPEMRTWTAEQLSAFLAAVANRDDFALWRLAATSGMRRGELLGLRWAAADLDARRVQIVQQRVRGADGFTYGPPKTAKGRRSIALDAVTVTALWAHRQAQGVIRPAFGPGYQDADLVFARADGSPMDPDSVSGTFERIVRRLGLPMIRLHDLRHTHATLALAAGVHPKVVQERLGHSSVAMTLDLYSHAVPAMEADAASRIAALIDAVAG
jgi:integrase